jgi:hypothetical protein
VVVETDGTYRAPDRKFACATQGTFDKTAGERHELQFKTSFTSLTFGMDDLTFDDLASMEAPENLGRLGNVDGKVIQTRKAAPERLATPESSWRRYLVILNAVVITAFLLWVWRTKRKAGDVT